MLNILPRVNVKVDFKMIKKTIESKRCKSKDKDSEYIPLSEFLKSQKTKINYPIGSWNPKFHFTRIHGLYDDDEDDPRSGSKITHAASPLPPVKKTKIKILKKGASVDALSPSPRCGGGRDVHGGATVGCKRKSLSGNGRLNSKAVQAPTCGVKQRLLSKMKRRKVQYNPTWIR
ncbi:unnamed protein product [Cuscuta epithymum]|uniref:Uncharacterized protein n=1 Tax=Cuscuta epithymum TaxID=186058 RepID=A0AAV0CWZ0_9ASTE|nr:unnamed protein product [Cuscuta epithymum]